MYPVLEPIVRAMHPSIITDNDDVIYGGPYVPGGSDMGWLQPGQVLRTPNQTHVILLGNAFLQDSLFFCFKTLNILYMSEGYLGKCEKLWSSSFNYEFEYAHVYAGIVYGARISGNNPSVTYVCIDDEYAYFLKIANTIRAIRKINEDRMDEYLADFRGKYVDFPKVSIKDTLDIFYFTGILIGTFGMGRVDEKLNEFHNRYFSAIKDRLGMGKSRDQSLSMEPHQLVKAHCEEIRRHLEKNRSAQRESRNAKVPNTTSALAYRKSLANVHRMRFSTTDLFFPSVIQVAAAEAAKSKKKKRSSNTDDEQQPQNTSSSKKDEEKKDEEEEEIIDSTFKLLVFGEPLEGAKYKYNDSEGTTNASGEIKVQLKKSDKSAEVELEFKDKKWKQVFHVEEEVSEEERPSEVQKTHNLKLRSKEENEERNNIVNFRFDDEELENLSSDHIEGE